MKIIDIELKQFYKRVEELGFTLRITDAAKKFVAEKGFDVQFGARPLKRAIQSHIEDPLSEILLKNEGIHNAQLIIDLNGDDIEAKIVTDNTIEITD